MEQKVYKPRQFNLSGLKGISDKTLEMHFKLYEGYVKNTNALNEKIAGLHREGAVPAESALVFSELTRHLGFEYNGMVLHEYYFDNLERQGAGAPAARSGFRQAVERTFPSYDQWHADFAAVGTMRGVGWAIAYLDPHSGSVSNHWISLHEDGNVAGHVPLLVMDVWEHAFILDYAPADRPKYIEAFFSNVNWGAVDQRVQAVETTTSTAAK